MSQYDIERLEAMLLCLRDQVDVLGDRLDTLRGEQTQQLNRLEAAVRAFRPRSHAPSVGRPTYPSTQGPSRGSGSESLA
jgi:hypothetical protein